MSRYKQHAITPVRGRGETSKRDVKVGRRSVSRLQWRKSGSTDRGRLPGNTDDGQTDKVGCLSIREKHPSLETSFGKNTKDIRGRGGGRRSRVKVDAGGE